MERYVANNILVHNCDELAAWQYLDEAWDMIQFSLRLGDRPIMVCTTTPKPKPLIIDLVNREGEDVIVTKASTYDNLANLAPTFKNQILQYEGTLQGRQEIMAEIIDPEEGGIIKRSMFRLWDASKPLPKFEYIVQSYDVATSDKTHNDPTACTVWGVFKPLDKPMAVMLIDCWSEHMQYPDLRPMVLEEATSIYGDSDEWSSGKKVDLILVEDKSAGISLIQDLQRAGLNVRAYNPGRADKTARLNIVSPIIAKGLVYLPESDVNENQVKSWIEPFLNQVCAFPEVRNDDYVDSCVDSLTQVKMQDGYKCIKDIQIGDMVQTPNGFKKVIAVHDNGMKEVWKVVIGSKELLATAEHKIMTNKGWIRVDALSQCIYNGYLLKEKSSWRLKNLTLLVKPLYSMVKNIVGILKAKIHRIVNTLVGQGVDFIEMCGNFIMVQYQKICTSIILMGIRSTMIYRILNVFWLNNIGMNIENKFQTLQKDLNKLLTLIGLEKKQKSGMVVKMAKSGIDSTQRIHWLRLGEFLEFIKKPILLVNGVALYLKEKVQKNYFVVRPVKTQSHDSEEVVVVTNTHTMRHVFDLTVEYEHCYYANDILVHNCTQALRILRDMGFLTVDVMIDEWEDYADGSKPKRVNPYAI